jgi:aspartyl-tRNA(Asn)/glutamyl-tRNA(Gln) amidotransferase subunit C
MFNAHCPHSNGDAIIPTTGIPAIAGEGILGLTREEVEHIAKLARLGLSEEDIVKFEEQLSEILDQFDVLRQLDTEDVPPTAHTLPLENVFSRDQARDSFPPADILANAPLSEEDLFRVRAVLE